MWFYVTVICLTLFSSSMVWWIFRKQEKENVAEQLDKNAYNHKVSKMYAANAMLRGNGKLRHHYNTMVMMYSNEKVYGKVHRSKVIIKIIKETDNLDVATAICALARIESNRRVEKHVR